MIDLLYKVDSPNEKALLKIFFIIVTMVLLCWKPSKSCSTMQQQLYTLILHMQIPCRSSLLIINKRVRCIYLEKLPLLIFTNVRRIWTHIQ